MFFLWLAGVKHADCEQNYPPQPLLAGFSSLTSSVPPAPEVPPLHPLLELPAPAFSPLQALWAESQPERLMVDPVIRPAMQNPASIFLRSLESINASCQIKGERFFPPGAGHKKSESKDKMQLAVEILKVVRSIDKIYNFAF